MLNWQISKQARTKAYNLCTIEEYCQSHFDNPYGNFTIRSDPKFSSRAAIVRNKNLYMIKSFKCVKAETRSYETHVRMDRGEIQKLRNVSPTHNFRRARNFKTFSKCKHYANTKKKKEEKNNTTTPR